MDTPLDRAHAAMHAAPGDDLARLRFFERLADAELVLLLSEEAEGGRISPEIFALEQGNFALAFDREERLATFTGGVAATATLSGRALARMLAGQGLGLGLNLGVAPSQYLIPAAALGWLRDMLSYAPQPHQARVKELRRPANLPEILIEALAVKLAQAAGYAAQAWLAEVSYADGQVGHMLAFIGALEDAQPALARAVHEALIFSGLEAGVIDVAFLVEADPLVPRLARLGLGFELPAAAAPEPRKPPGSDPERPPRLR